MPAAVWILPLLLLSAAPGPTLKATRTQETIHLDGKADEAAWATAAPFDAFRESFPNEGANPGEFRTEARILYDDEFLYVSVVAFDPQPSLIERPLGRRDSSPFSDRVEVAIDSAADGRTGYDFIVNAAGVLRDKLLFGDVSESESWDAVWDGAVAERPDGWSMEVAIPFRILRFASNPDKPWGMVIRRQVARTHQLFDSTVIPRNANPTNTGGLVVSRFGALVGISNLKPQLDVELLPYAAARVTSRPQYSDPNRPNPQLIDPSLDVGLDFKIPITSDLTLNGAINPDFGQVEADQVIQNLGTSEQFFPEKRPFFLEGLDLFQPVGSGYGTPHQIFYSRRIGLDAPILGAAKVTGSVGKGLDIGVLDALVMGAGVGEMNEDAPDRRWQFHLTQPLHLGPNDALPAARPLPTNYFAAVARQRFSPSASAGVVFTAATPLDAKCKPEDFANPEDYSVGRCASRGVNAAALDVDVRDSAGVWGAYGEIEGSQQVGGDPEGRTLRDGTVIHPGDLGIGGHMRAGKLGGEPFRFNVTYVYEGKTLDLNGVGFQQLSDFMWTDLNLHYVRPNGFGKFRNFSVDYNLDLNWDASGQFMRGVNTNLYSQVQLPSYDTIAMRVGLEAPQYDTREIAFSGVPYERMADLFLTLIFNSDPSRKLIFEGDIFGFRGLPRGDVPAITGWGWDATVTWRPQARLETLVEASYGHKPQGARWVRTEEDETAVFGFQDPAFFSVTLRQQLVITPRLTAQVYAQLFSGTVRYGNGYSASLVGRDKLDVDQLTPMGTNVSEHNSHFSAFNLNAVIRWEYRLGSTLYLVYTRSQSERPAPLDEGPSRSVLPSRLFEGPASQTVMVKWSYWWNV